MLTIRWSYLNICANFLSDKIFYDRLTCVKSFFMYASYMIYDDIIYNKNITANVK